MSGREMMYHSEGDREISEENLEKFQRKVDECGDIIVVLTEIQDEVILVGPFENAKDAAFFAEELKSIGVMFGNIMNMVKPEEIRKTLRICKEGN